MTTLLSRRAFLARSAAIGCCTAASPFLTRISLAAAPWDARLVVIVLRGGMDGIDAIRPYGDPDYAALRPTLAGSPADGGPDLDGFFALHPALAPLMPMWQAGEMGVVQAVATPYRDKRSHFDGQDLLEAGTNVLGTGQGGWLNRMLQALPGVEARTAYAIGHGEMRVLDGPAPVADWSPEANLSISPQAERLAGMMMEGDPLFHAALTEALMLSRDAGPILGDTEEAQGGGMAAMARPGGNATAHLRVAEFAARQLAGDARVAAFSINGWDTHKGQGKALSNALGRLADTLVTLRDGLGPQVWGRTAVLAMTEFGRTVRENGTGGTDHGTGGAMIHAGGALRGGRVSGRWPGLAEAALYERRDLMPTSDLRARAGWVIHGLTGLDRAVLEGRVFPGMDMGSDPGLLR
jgi:uncharacterized protein (DUF1501 family)